MVIDLKNTTEDDKEVCQLRFIENLVKIVYS